VVQYLPGQIENYANIAPFEVSMENVEQAIGSSANLVLRLINDDVVEHKHVDYTRLGPLSSNGYHKNQPLKYGGRRIGQWSSNPFEHLRGHLSKPSQIARSPRPKHVISQHAYLELPW
jgi:hypothetical protein